MNDRNTIRVGASVVYGAVVAVLAVLGSPALATVAIVGGIALGVLYVVTGRLPGPARTSPRAPRVRARHQ